MLKLHHAPDMRAGRIVWLLEQLQLPSPLFPKHLQWLHCCEGMVKPPGLHAR
jgi:hypothetical protein